MANSNMIKIALLVICMGLVSVSFGQQFDSLLGVLKTEIERQDTYVNRKLNRIDALQKRLSGVKDNVEKFEIYNGLYHEYKTFVNDSAFKYSQLLRDVARDRGDPSLAGYANLKFCFVLLSSGMFKETFDTLKTIKSSTLADSSRIDYYRLSARAMADLTVYNKGPHFREIYTELYTRYTDSALMVSPSTSYSYDYIKSLIAQHRGNYREMLDIEQELISRHKLNYPQYAVFYYDVAAAYLSLGNEQKGIENLIMSSVSDIRGAVKENAAMYTLARLLHQRGDTENAYICIRQALKDAVFYGSRQRQVEINSILPIIATDRMNTAEEKRQRLVTYSIGVTLIVILVTFLSIVIYRQLKRLRAADAVITEANRNLKEYNSKLMVSDRIKEEYVAYYFNMTAEYVNRIDTLRKQIMSLLVNDKKKEALAILGKYNPGQERARFVKDFDQVFLRLFPDFVQQFNKLIDPSNPIVPENEGELISDLRIFALIRLGIHDNKKISEILNFSVNTIYAYKTRVKGKSIVADDEFLKRIMEIKSIEETTEAVS